MDYNVRATPEVPAYWIRLRDGALLSDMTRRRYHQCCGHFGLAVLVVVRLALLRLCGGAASAQLPAAERHCFSRMRVPTGSVSESCSVLA